jgi:hypothetical protein
VGESYLKNLIRTVGRQDFCSYCDEETGTFSLDEVADLIERAFDEHYNRTATDPDGWEYAMHSDPEMEYEWEREGESAKWAILSAADVSEEIAEDIRSVLEDRHSDFDSAAIGKECPFDEESHYAEKDAGHGEFLMLWRDFESGLKTQARFFSPLAKIILDQIFDGIADLRTRERKPVVVHAGPEMPIANLYRARVFAGEDNKLKEALKAPWKHIGTPPTEDAGAGRMNARGIGVFYGALNPETALSEVRPPVGSDVVVAKFNIMRPLRLLDLEALKMVAVGGSIFDPATLMKMQRANFLDDLSRRMSRPVMPHEEASEYLTTQAVADYLANVARLDGIIYPSIQTGNQSSNVVLFHHAARVEEVELPKGTKVDVQLFYQNDEEVHPDYTVWEEAPPSLAEGAQGSLSRGWMGAILHPLDYLLESRYPALKIVLESVQVHRVNAVKIDTTAQEVTRHRTEKAVKSTMSGEVTTADMVENLDFPFG